MSTRGRVGDRRSGVEWEDENASPTLKKNKKTEKNSKKAEADGEWTEHE